ncbi:MAG: hypothetical protein IJB52_14725, partial [Clostridia bacterium]|nr:hypothetical protein [Clostridia bacterium]
IRTNLECDALADLQMRYPESFGWNGIPEQIGDMQASPVLDIAEDCPTVRVRRSETEDAVLWFVHNRGDDCAVTVREAGEIVVFDPVDGIGRAVISDGEFTLELPSKAARMLVKEK